MTKNQILTVRIESLTAKGIGIARCDGQVIFVPAVADGDLCEIKIIKLTSSYAVAKLERVIEYSKDRIMNSCSAFPRCGGCSFRHISYDKELEVKKQTVIDAVNRIGGLEIPVGNVLCTGETDSYRNKAQYPLGEENGKIVLGFYADHTHRIISCEKCKIQPQIFNDIMKYAVEFFNAKKLSAYNEINGKGLLRHCYLRINKFKKVMFCLVINADNFKYEKEFAEYLSQNDAVASVFLNFNRNKSNVILSDSFKCIYGSEYIEDEFYGLKLRMSPDSFYQVNRLAAQLLYRTAFDLLPHKAYENVFDLYCGVGSIGISFMKYASEHNMGVGRLIGYEVVEKAIESAKLNAKNNGIENASFYVGDLSSPPEALMRELTPSLVIVDPPRKGCSSELVELFCKMNIPYILYISCDPATLARDMKFLSTEYSFSGVTPVDLFPRTSHVECAVLCTRGNVK